MTFTPVLPSGGYSGWSFLTRTLAAQKQAFVTDPAIQRDEDYFRDKIGKIDTAEKLVGDRRLLSVALAAYGLEGDANNTYFFYTGFLTGMGVLSVTGELFDASDAEITAFFEEVLTHLRYGR